MFSFCVLNDGNLMVKKKTNGFDEIAEDTDEILEDTSSIDKKTTWLIALWILDKLILIGMFLWLGR